MILSLLVAGFWSLFGKLTCAGLLSGALVSSVQLAISMSSTGGAWDNAKNLISHAKGSDTHKNTVTGDTVEDPLKDTSGPALNRVMKPTAILSLVLGSPIVDASDSEGGPFLDELTAVTVLYLFESAGDRLLSVRSLHGGEAVCCPLVGRSFVQSPSELVNLVF